MFLWTSAYQSLVSGGDLKLLDPQLQVKLGVIYLHFKQLDRYGQKLIDLEGVPSTEKAEKDFLILMEQTTTTTLKLIPNAIEFVDAELMKATHPTGWKRRVRRATKFFELSLGLFVVVLFTWLYNREMDTYSTNPTWYEYWVLSLTIGAVFFWVVSRLNPEAWKSIARMIGWKEDE